MSTIPPDSAPSTGKALRTLSLWAVLILGTIALVQLASQRRSTKIEISYNQFVTELEQHNVAEVVIMGTRHVEGRFKTVRTTGSGTGSEFALTLPFDADEAWVSKIVGQGVDVRGSKEKQSLAMVILTFLPYALIFALIIFMIRQMKARRKEE
jgi:ATP-dependent Zn protease